MFGKFEFGAVMFGDDNDQIIAVTSIPDDSSVGSPHVNFVIGPSSIPDVATVGHPQLNLIVHPSSVPDTADVGSPTLTVGPVTIHLDGEDTWLFGASMFGEYPQWHEGYGIPSDESFGSPSVRYVQTVAPIGIPATDLVGTPQLNLTIYPASVPDTDAVGFPSVIVDLVGHTDPYVGVLVEVPVFASVIVRNALAEATLTSDTPTGVLASNLIKGVFSTNLPVQGVLVEAGAEYRGSVAMPVDSRGETLEASPMVGTMEEVAGPTLVLVENVDEELLAAVA